MKQDGDECYVHAYLDGIDFIDIAANTKSNLFNIVDESIAKISDHINEGLKWKH